MRVLWIIALAGCSFEHGKVVEPADAARGDGVIDMAIDAALRDPGTCPQGPAGIPCTVFTCPGSRSCYYLCGNTSSFKFTWSTAASSCTNAGGCLVTINDQAEQNCIAATAAPTNGNVVWIGFHQDAVSTGNWSWACGTSSYLHPLWAPDNEDLADCAGMVDGARWDDLWCAGTARMVCEITN